MGRRLVAGLTVDGFCILFRAGCGCSRSQSRSRLHRRDMHIHETPTHLPSSLPSARNTVMGSEKALIHSFFIHAFGFIYCGSYKNEIVRELVVFFVVVAYITTHTGFDGGSCFFFVVYTFLLECIFWFYYTRWLGCFVCCKNNIPFRCKYILLVCVKCSLYRIHPRRFSSCYDPFYPLFESLVTKKTRDSGPINNV